MRTMMMAAVLVAATGGALAQQPASKPASGPAAKDKEKAAANSPEVQAILNKANDATKALMLVRYEFEYKRPGERAISISGSAVRAPDGKKDTSKPGKFKMESVVNQGGTTKEVTLGFDGETYYMIDAAKKTVYADIDPAVMGQSMMLMQLAGMLEFVHPTPFDDELNGEAQLKPAAKVGDEECNVVSVVYKGGAGEAEWYFSKKDSLPRRVDRVLPTRGDEKMKSQMILSKLIADPKFVSDPFKLVVPEGYTKTDKAPS